MKEINEELAHCPETIFDEYDLHFDARSSGNALREELVRIANLYGNINKLATNALLLYEQAKIKREKVEVLAWEAIYERNPTAKISQQKIFVKTIPVYIDGRETCLNDEEDKLSLYEYVYNRGKDKTREIASLLDIGRTLLSWDKTELTQNLGA
jgi:hypothetical protein